MTRYGKRGTHGVPTDYVSKRTLDRQVDRIERVLANRKGLYKELRDRTILCEKMIQEILALRVGKGKH